MPTFFLITSSIGVCDIAIVDAERRNAGWRVAKRSINLLGISKPWFPASCKLLCYISTLV